jgi:uncharacterized protein
MKGKKLNYKALSVNVVICLISTFLSQFGVACYYGCGLGTDPISVFIDGLHGRFGLTYGQISTICYVILGLLLFFFERKHLGISTIINIVIGGQLLDWCVALVGNTFPIDEIGFVTKLIILLVALIATGIGYGMSIACNLGVGTFQFVPLFICDYLHIELKYAQIISDAAFFIIGWLLGGVVGVGTIVSVFLTGFILDWTVKYTLKFTDKFGKMVE